MADVGPLRVRYLMLLALVFSLVGCATGGDPDKAVSEAKAISEESKRMDQEAAKSLPPGEGPE
jgi:PBP1b-binding outer membrane lipoprotein LpoB